MGSDLVLTSLVNRLALGLSSLSSKVGIIGRMPCAPFIWVSGILVRYSGLWRALASKPSSQPCLQLTSLQEWAVSISTPHLTPCQGIHIIPSFPVSVGMSSCPTSLPDSATEGLWILTHHYSLGTWVWHSCSYWNWLPKLQCLVPVILPSFSFVTHTSVSVLTFWMTHDIPLQKPSSWIQVPGGHIKSILRSRSSVTPDFNSFHYLPQLAPSTDIFIPETHLYHHCYDSHY